MTQRDQAQITQRKNFEQEQLVGYWLKTRGITRKALETHPHIDDVILLLKYRDAMWDLLNNSERAVWGAYWGYTYNKRKALKKKSLAKLEQITITATTRREETKAAIQRIKALR